MTNFQTLALIFGAALVAATISATALRVINRRAAFAWTILWLGAAAAIARPSLTMTVARFLGIGRGADLVFYCAILAMLVGFFIVYLRLKRLDRHITVLVRHAAIREATIDKRTGGVS